MTRQTKIDLAAFAQVLPLTFYGKVLDVASGGIRALLPGAQIGQIARIYPTPQRRNTAGSPDAAILSEVVGFDAEQVLLAPLHPHATITPGYCVEISSAQPRLHFHAGLLGSVLSAHGRVLDRLPSNPPRQGLPTRHCQLHASPPPAVERPRVSSQLHTGLRSLDVFVPIGLGQRLALLAEPGVGKSSLLGQLCQSPSTDYFVIALIGERGRELREFLHSCLSPEARARSIVVVSTSDEAAIARIRGALLAMALAEYLRDCGSHVLLLVDSLTRLVRAYREVGLANGEMPVRQGYPGSVFAALPRFIERAGTSKVGTITALYSVLRSSTLDEDPMVEEICSLTDGHVELRSDYAQRGIYPAVDVLRSLSRLAPQIQALEQYQRAERLRPMLAWLEDQLSSRQFTPTASVTELVEAASRCFESFLAQRAPEPFDVVQRQAAKLEDELSALVQQSKRSRS